MKKTASTVVASAAVITLIVLSFALSDFSLTEDMKKTLVILLTICGCSIVYCFTVGEITHNYSQMDKLWSVLPVVYTWIIAARGGFGVRLTAFALIVTAWGVRLTVNFARKGAYRLKFWEGNEDYRWSIVRKSPVFRRPVVWTLFDLFFISVYQNLLVLAICLPALACTGSDAPFGAVDVIAVVLSVAFLLLETVSDEYQWKFHRKKKELLAEGKPLPELPRPYNLGFNTTGPWAYMRHPNYLGEQGMWASLYLFVIGAGAASRALFHPTALGALLLILLFMGSSALGEKISSGKYPAYKDYTAQVFKYLPLRRFDPDKKKGNKGS